MSTTLARYAPALLGLILFPACRGIEADTLYVRHLPGAPVERDWNNAVPLRVMVSGGAVHRDARPVAAQEVDQDTVHRNTASCHHGPAQKSTFPLWLRAYYDERHLYLRLCWPDQTRDRESRRWVRRGGAWHLEGEEGDGVALVFPQDAGPAFTCAVICHLDDWNMAEGRFQESARMRFMERGKADLWLWRASDRVVRDLHIDQVGIHPDRGPDALREPNSRRASTGQGSLGGASLVFGPGDEPFADAAGRPLPPDWRPAEGTVLPVYLPLPESQRRSTIQASERYRDGLWEVTLVRPLATGDPGDMVFQRGDTYLFGLSVMDNTLRNHHIVDTSWKLKMLS